MAIRPETLPIRLYLDELYDALTLPGHPQLQVDEACSPGLPPFRTVLSADQRELAWWCEDSRSWFLNAGADHPLNPVTGVAPPAAVLLNPAAAGMYQMVPGC